MIKLTIPFSCLALFLSSMLFSQVGIGTATPSPSAALELASLNKALILPHAALTSKTDITTILNPAAGLVVYNTNTSIASIENNLKVYADIPYVFNGTQWQEMIGNHIDPSVTLPQVIAKGRKTTTDTSCANLNSAPFALDVKDNINDDGSIIAKKSGFYKFTISLGMTAQPNQFLPVLYYGPNNAAADNIRFSFTFRGNSGYANRNITYSAVMYLNANETSGYFQWILGGNNRCTADNKVNQQEVIWQYLGNL